jgi:hypothetical protein
MAPADCISPQTELQPYDTESAILTSTPQQLYLNDTIQFGPIFGLEFPPLDETVPLQTNYEKEPRQVMIRRASCLDDMIGVFSWVHSV